MSPAHTISKYLPYKLLRNVCEHSILFPFYHTISDCNLPHTVGSFIAKNRNWFRRDLDFLCKHYIPIGLDDINKYVNTSGHKYFHLSFDDALREVFTIVPPILAEYGIKATCFVNSRFIEQNDIMFRYKENLNRQKINYQNYIKLNPIYGNKDQLQSWIDQGHAIGSHSYDHPYFQEISISEQLHQVQNDINYFKSNFNYDIYSFAFPFYSYGIGTDFFSQLPNQILYTFGTSGIKNDTIISHYHRIDMEQPYDADIILKKQLLFYQLKKIMNKNTLVR